MSEKLYRLLLQLYPRHFRRTYGDEALRLVLDRARDEKGLLRRLRLCLDLLLDLAISLPREHFKAPPARVLIPTDLSFQLLTEPSPSPALLFVAGLLTALAFWICVTAVAASRTFPAQFPLNSYSLQAIVQKDVALARSPSDALDSAPAGAYSFCMTAIHDIAANPLQPLMRFNFASPGASGVALIDGKIVQTFKLEQHLWIHADLPAGNHWLDLRVDKPASNVSISTTRGLKNCPVISEPRP